MADLLSRLRSKVDDAAQAAPKYRPVIGRDYYPSELAPTAAPMRPASDYRDARLPPPVAPPPPFPVESYERFAPQAQSTQFDEIPFEPYPLTAKEAVFSEYKAAMNPENIETPARMRALIEQIQSRRGAR